MTRIALILGAGRGVGQSVAEKLIAEGYKVAAASRNPNLATAKATGFHPIKVDLGKPEEIPGVFAEVQKELGGPPNVVIYNAWASTFPLDPEDILPAISPAQLSAEHTVNTISFWAAAQAAVASWEALGADVPTACIFTGNELPWINLPTLVSLGIGKTSSAFIVEALAGTYGKRGSRFYFAYQVDRDGGMYFVIDGPATANVYWDLIGRSEQGNWRVAFDQNGKYWDVGEAAAVAATE